MSTRLSIAGDSKVFALKISKALTGEAYLSLATDDGNLRLTFPVALFPFLDGGEGEVVYTTLSVLRVGVEPEPVAAGVPVRGLIPPGSH